MDIGKEGQSVLCTVGYDIRSCAVDYLLGHCDLGETTLLSCAWPAFRYRVGDDGVVVCNCHLGVW